MTTQSSRIWHIGIVVPTLEQGMEELGAALGLTWRTPFHAETDLLDEHGVSHHIEVHGTFSAGGPPAIELMQAVPGTPIDFVGGSSFHHIGYWSDDVLSEKERLGSSGWPCTAFHPRTDRARTVVINRGPFGLGLEPCAVTEDRPHLRDLFPQSSPFFGVPEERHA